MKKLCILLILIIFVSCIDKTEKIVIIHTDAMKAKVLPKKSDGKYTGGFSLLASAIFENRKDRFAITLDAGSSINGSVFSFYTQGKSIVEFLEYMKYDAILIDNREFDNGLNNIKKLRNNAGFEMMSSNIVSKKDRSLIFKPYIIKESPKGNKIAILSITDEKAKEKIFKEFFKGYDILSAEEVLDYYLPLLEKEADIIILLSSLKEEKDIEIAEKYSKYIDLIIGRTRKYKKKNQSYNINGVDVVHTQGKTQTLGVYEITYHNKKGIIDRKWKNTDISSENYNPDPEMGKRIERYSVKIETILSEKVGSSLKGLSYIDEKESEISNFIADLMLKKSKAEMSFINEGAIRDGFSKDISKGDIYNVFPFPNVLVRGDLQGKYIKKILLKGLRDKVDIIPSGIKVKYINKGKLDFIELDKKLEDEKYYKIASSDFLIEGGDGYIEFKNTKNLEYIYSIRALLNDYIKENSPIDGNIDNRVLRMEIGE